MRIIAGANGAAGVSANINRATVYGVSSGTRRNSSTATMGQTIQPMTSVSVTNRRSRSGASTARGVAASPTPNRLPSMNTTTDTDRALSSRQTPRALVIKRPTGRYAQPAVDLTIGGEAMPTDGHDPFRQRATETGLPSSLFVVSVRTSPSTSQCLGRLSASGPEGAPRGGWPLNT